MSLRPDQDSKTIIYERAVQADIFAEVSKLPQSMTTALGSPSREVYHAPRRERNPC